MIVVLDKHGTAIKKHSKRFVVVCDEKEEEYSALKVEQIVVTAHCSITSEAILLAMQHGIDIVFLSLRGNQYARIYGPTQTGPVATRRNQLQSSSSNKGFALSRNLIYSKISNMRRLLMSLYRTRGVKKPAIHVENLSQVQERIMQLRLKERDTLFGLEGEGSKLYFTVLSQFLDKSLYLGHRSKHPAKDLFNAYLNYGYGILYSEVERACILNGLDPYVGVQHADRSNKKSFVYDFIEQFRQPVVDREVITLFARRRVAMSDVDERFYLTKTGKMLIIPALMNKLEKTYTYENERLSLRSIIHRKARECARFFNGEREYSPFMPGWL